MARPGTWRARLRSSWSSLGDRPLAPALASLALALVLVGALLVAGRDVSLLVHAGPPATSAAEARGSLTVQPAARAADGQFSYRLGVAPWSTAEQVAGVTFDDPAVRNARWGYGALAWLGSLGDPDLVPWSLVAVNLLAAGALGWCGGAWAVAGGRHALWGVAFALWPGFAHAVAMDTPELTAGAFALAGLVALRAQRVVVAMVALSAAVVTRDSMAAIPLGLGIAGAVCLVAPGRRAREQAADLLVTATVTAAVFLGWQQVLQLRFGEVPLEASLRGDLATPVVGLARRLGRLLPPEGADAGAHLASLALLVGLLLLVGRVVVAGARHLAGSRGRWPAGSGFDVGLWAAWVVAALVAVALDDHLWSVASTSMWGTTEVGLLSIAVLLHDRSLGGRWRALAVVALAVCWAATAVVQVQDLA